MDRFSTWPRGLAGVKACFWLPIVLALHACGGSAGSSSTTSNTGGQVVVSNGSETYPYDIQVSIPMTPQFNPAIHDYVVHCTSNEQIDVTASLYGGQYFGFSGPGEPDPQLSGVPLGAYHESVTLSAGQRFQFIVGNASSPYSVRCLPSDFPPLTVAVTGAPQAEWYLFAPTLAFVPPAIVPTGYVVMTDANGTPVWWMAEPRGRALDAKILGPNEITWTVQTNEPVAQYLIRNFAGQYLQTVGSGLNDHDLQPTSTGTWLAIKDVQRICPPDCADMSQWGGGAEMGPLDQEIVELDQKSNIIWTWRTRDHIALVESGLGGFFPTAGNDIIHMNAVQPDGTDAVLFSARHLSAIYRIIKATGAIDWKIGGVPTTQSLPVIGDPRPTATGPNAIYLSGQHDVRKWPDLTISVHDNGTVANRPPYIVRYNVDDVGRTATVVEEIEDRIDTLSSCCGSARRMPLGHWLVQWGGLPYMTEVDGAGDPVLTIKYNVGQEFSYRAIPVLTGEVSGDVLRHGMDAMAN